eukprot:TRINITY_DN3448_c0_g1_i1.p1 TRINITY_DN3448_c0_g1~~TRINITY_DN3448_c0_g1_i1.p1  ORF type:complete len:281 (+),score=56.44 TRINITY_DN3448_c0_g1_i1:286-1128(+)
MRTTLFVTDIPFNLQETEFVNLFASSEGFITARLRSDRNRNIVGFVEFENEQTAKVAKNEFNQYKFSVTDTGLNVRFSHASNTSYPPTPSGRPRLPAGRGERAEHNPIVGSHPPLAAPAPGAAPTSPAGRGTKSQPVVVENFPPYYHNPSVNYPHNGYGHQPAGSYFMQQPLQATIYPPDASTTLYVEGLPNDTTEREVAHIFRPFPGYQSVRLLQKESKTNPSKIYTLCFVEFDSKYQASVSMNALNGYRMDKNDSKGLKISYAKARKERRGSATGDEE